MNAFDLIYFLLLQKQIICIDFRWLFFFFFWLIIVTFDWFDYDMLWFGGFQHSHIFYENSCFTVSNNGHNSLATVLVLSESSLFEPL